jgi:hypothetical protein
LGPAVTALKSRSLIVISALAGLGRAMKLTATSRAAVSDRMMIH